MTGRGYGVPAVQIEILVAVARVDPDSFATFSGDRHLLVRSELKPVFDLDHRSHGFVPTSSKPVFSSRPNMRFMFCTACPAAPFTRLSMAEKTTICFPRAANPRSQKLVVFTQLMSGEPSTRRTKKESR